MTLGGPPRRGAAPHVFVDDIDDPVLAADDRHHLERVLRLRQGDPLTISDGVGRWRPCRLGDGLEPAGDVEFVPPPAVAVTVAFALAKGQRAEWIVQKLTEVGVDRVVPFTADRSVARWDAAKAPREVARLRTIARAAAMQSRRCWLPEVDDLSTFDALAAGPGAARAEPGGDPPSLDRPLVLVGPEGGWSDRERAAGVATVALGPHVLRTETAAVAAGVLLTALRAGLVGGTGRASTR